MNGAVRISGISIGFSAPLPLTVPLPKYMTIVSKWPFGPSAEERQYSTARRRDARLLAALCVGAFFGLAMWAGGHPERSDFAQIWYGARAMFAGVNPYDVVGPGRQFEWNFPLLYPLPALLVASPIALLPLPVCLGVFVAVSVGALVWCLTHDGWQRLPLLLSVPLLYAVGLVQWSPLLTAAALVPALGFLLVAKPTIGAALWCYRPSLRAVVGAVAVLAISVALRPSWIVEWLKQLPSASHMVQPIGHGLGPLLVLALLRWRRPEARLLLALACVPQTALLYEAVPLLVIPKTWVESLSFTALSWVALFVWKHLTLPVVFGDEVLLSAKLILIPFLYLPCLLMVLLRANEAPGAASIESGVGCGK